MRYSDWFVVGCGRVSNGKPNGHVSSYFDARGAPRTEWLTYFLGEVGKCVADFFREMTHLHYFAPYHRRKGVSKLGGGQGDLRLQTTFPLRGATVNANDESVRRPRSASGYVTK
jgi:hypothetical protein